MGLDPAITRVPTSPVATGGRRRVRLVVGAVLGVVASSFLLAQLSPRSEPVIQDAIVPGPSIQPVVVRAPPLPHHEWFSAPAAPIQGVLLEAGGVRWLRLATARLAPETLAQPGRDLLLREARGGTVCLCWRSDGIGPEARLVLDRVRVDDDLTEVDRTTVTTLDRPSSGAPGNAPAQVALEPSPDGRTAYLVRTSTAGPRREVALDVIDLPTGTIVETTTLTSLPGDDRAVLRPVADPILRIAPDGGHAYVALTMERQRRSGPQLERRAWIVTLGESRIDEVTELEASSEVTADPCAWTAFFEAGIVAQGCLADGIGSTRAYGISRIDLGGHDLGRTPADPALVDIDVPIRAQPLLDLTHGRAFAWDPIGHTLLSADVVRSVWGRATVADPGRAARQPATGQPRPTGEGFVAWSDGRSATDIPTAHHLVGSADGRLLFAAGIRPADGAETPTVADGGASSGIWVFDSETLELLDHWPAMSMYESIATLDGGRWLMAIGRPGVTADGAPADWGRSFTIHDAATGRPVVRIGDLGSEAPVTFPAPGRPIATGD